MACFVVPAVEAVVVSVIKAHVARKEKKAACGKVELEDMNIESICNESKHSISFSKKLGWLSNLLWGGSFLLAIEHVWHGEVIPYPPFLSAMSNAEDTLTMLKEMSTVGVSMAVLVTAVWGCVAAVASRAKKRDLNLKTENEEA